VDHLSLSRDKACQHKQILSSRTEHVGVCQQFAEDPHPL